MSNANTSDPNAPNEDLLFPNKKRHALSTAENRVFEVIHFIPRQRYDNGIEGKYGSEGKSKATRNLLLDVEAIEKAKPLSLDHPSLSLNPECKHEDMAGVTIAIPDSDESGSGRSAEATGTFKFANLKRSPTCCPRVWLEHHDFPSQSGDEEREIFARLEYSGVERESSYRGVGANSLQLYLEQRHKMERELVLELEMTAIYVRFGVTKPGDPENWDPSFPGSCSDCFKFCDSENLDRYDRILGPERVYVELRARPPGP